MLTLHVEADSYDKLVKDCWAALGLQLQNVKPVAAPTEAKTTHIQEAKTETKPESNGAAEEGKKKAGRPKKEEAQTVSTPAPSTGTPTLETVRQALQSYAEKASGGNNQTVGILKAREVLAKFTSVKGEPCQKISEVKDVDYAKVLELCAA